MATEKRDPEAARAGWEAREFACTNCHRAIPFDSRLPGLRCALCPHCRHPLASAQARAQSSYDHLRAGIEAEIEWLRTPGHVCGEHAMADRLSNLLQQGGSVEQSSLWPELEPGHLAFLREEWESETRSASQPEPSGEDQL